MLGEGNLFFFLGVPLQTEYMCTFFLDPTFVALFFAIRMQVKGHKLNNNCNNWIQKYVFYEIQFHVLQMWFICITGYVPLCSITSSQCVNVANTRCTLIQIKLHHIIVVKRKFLSMLQSCDPSLAGGKKAKSPAVKAVKRWKSHLRFYHGNGKN